MALLSALTGSAVPGVADTPLLLGSPTHTILWPLPGNFPGPEVTPGLLPVISHLQHNTTPPIQYTADTAATKLEKTRRKIFPKPFPFLFVKYIHATIFFPAVQVRNW